MSLILVNATLSFATCMLTESSLSYMGFGIAPPTPTWGNMLTGANNSIVIQQYWWRWVFRLRSSASARSASTSSVMRCAMRSIPSPLSDKEGLLWHY